MAALARRTPLVLGVLVVGSAAIRFVAAWDAEIPWISPDEIVYALTGESLWEHGTLTLRGLAAPYTSLVTPALVGAPLAALGVDEGLRVAQALQSLVMATAAVPVFLWARRLASPGWALVAATLTLLVPGLAYGSTLMTEAAYYPLAVAAIATGALVLERPTLLRQGSFFALVTLAAAVRMQALVLVPTLLLAALLHARITRSWAVARALAPIGAVAAVAGLGAAVVAGVAGSGSLWENLLGAYQPVLETSTSVADVVRAIGVHAVGVALVCLVVPLAAAIVVCVRAFARPASGADAAYAAITAAYVPLLAVQVAVFSAQNVGYLSQRYLLTAAPVLFVGFAAWLHRGAPRPRVVVGVSAAAILVGTAAAPVGDLVPGTGVQDALWTTWLRGLAAESQWAARAVLVVAAATLLAVAILPRRRAVASVVVVAAGLLALSVDATRTVVHESRLQQVALVGADSPHWVAEDYAPVVLLATGDQPSRAIARTFFWNPAVTFVVALDDLEVTVPPSPPSLQVERDGELRSGDGAPLSAPFVLASSTVTLAGEVVEQRIEPEAQVPGWRLWRAEQPVRVTTRVIGALPNGDFEGRLTVLAPGCRRGALELTLLGKSGEPIAVTVDGIPWGELQAPNGVVVRASVPAPPYADGDHICVFDLETEGYTGSTRIEYVPG